MKILGRLTDMQHPNIVNFMSFWHDKVSNQDRVSVVWCVMCIILLLCTLCVCVCVFRFGIYVCVLVYDVYSFRNLCTCIICVCECVCVFLSTLIWESMCVCVLVSV